MQDAKQLINRLNKLARRINQIEGKLYPVIDSIAKRYAAIEKVEYLGYDDGIEIGPEAIVVRGKYKHCSSCSTDTSYVTFPTEWLISNTYEENLKKFQDEMSSKDLERKKKAVEALKKRVTELNKEVAAAEADTQLQQYAGPVKYPLTDEERKLRDDLMTKEGGQDV